MAVLPDEDRRRTFAHVMRQRDTFGSIAGILKADLRAAVDAADTWVDGNAAAFNSALPQPFRGAANAQQKTLLLCFVAMRRAGLLRTTEDG